MQWTKNPEENNIKTRQQIKKGRSKRCCCHQSTWLIIAPILHRYHSAVAPLSLRCRSVVAPLSRHYHTAIVPLSLRCCRSVVALLLHRYHTGIAPLLLRCCHSCCFYTVLPLSLQCRSASVASAVATQAILLSPPLSRRYRAVIAPLSHRCRSAIASIALLPLLLLLLSQRYHCCYRSCCHSRSSPQD